MIRIEKVKPDYISEITIIHLKSFKDFFLSSLGSSFLKLYYSSCIKSKKCIALCAIDNEGKILGFAFGSKHSKGFHKEVIIKNVIPFFIKGCLILFSRPKAILRIYKNTNKSKSQNDDGNYAELLSIGVLPEEKGRGIGKLLLHEFEKKITNENVNKITLTTDANENESVLRFYKSSGYKEFYTFITYPKRTMIKLIKNL